MSSRTRCDIQNLSLKTLFKNRGDRGDVQFLKHRKHILAEGWTILKRLIQARITASLKRLGSMWRSADKNTRFFQCHKKHTSESVSTT